MKPFDLDAALNGAAVMTRIGWDVTDITARPVWCVSWPIMATIHRRPHRRTFNLLGRYVSNDFDSPYDLFMKD